MSKAKYQGYEQLETILGEALEQAAAGKGKERHATGQAFEDQPMQLISKLLDDNHGLAFQAIKKIQESLRLSPDRAERELLGAINYIAGMIIFLRAEVKAKAHAKAKDLTITGAHGILDALQTNCLACGKRHYAWDMCDPYMRDHILGRQWAIKPIELKFDPKKFGTLVGDCAITNATTNATTNTATPTKNDTVPLKQYNELLAQYTQLERRLQELN